MLPCPSFALFYMSPKAHSQREPRTIRNVHPSLKSTYRARTLGPLLSACCVGWSAPIALRPWDTAGLSNIAMQCCTSASIIPSCSTTDGD
ncbi:hypothetical protein BCV69DRAFT_71313 [Microstroma glucosiphilum]|uniref:Uncharacterized protein n=1 Tax=Pseudomicrostroma glucosiphilum TaxID=1684307 RepID=A0A316TZG6_9BASI|nr:hypothetical protein BCV69DRAFT_71313 [Pseudomicrostroma glucosiphilum]PWN18380.1 hypothetical protein BCV69DRAFT_71313 [Pseudomicrostroma glucosiphilum]